MDSHLHDGSAISSQSAHRDLDGKADARVGRIRTSRSLWLVHSDEYWGVNRSLLNAVERQQIREGLVFVKSNYGAVLPANSPWLDQPLIFAIDRGNRNHRLIELFPKSTPWLEQEAGLVPHPRIESLGSRSPEK